mmetsp:Transcript_81879/g.145031  ORF Transcript_81879/g.145031 Transcript_81879/m.145031 type:complete len:147 (-) Transcript_81879:261-701(-)
MLMSVMKLEIILFVLGSATRGSAVRYDLSAEKISAADISSTGIVANSNIDNAGNKTLKQDKVNVELHSQSLDSHFEKMATRHQTFSEFADQAHLSQSGSTWFENKVHLYLKRTPKKDGSALFLGIAGGVLAASFFCFCWGMSKLRK